MGRAYLLGVLGVLAISVMACYAVPKTSKHLHPLGDDMINFISNVIKPNWTTVRNFHPDIDMSYIKKLCGVLPGSETFRLPKKRHLLGGLLIPKEVDSRTKWPHCPFLKEVQGACGSCWVWAFAATDAMTDRYCIAEKGTRFHFSAENLVSCCDECGNGCNGGFPSAAWEYWVETGIVSGGAYDSHYEASFHNSTRDNVEGEEESQGGSGNVLWSGWVYFGLGYVVGLLELYSPMGSGVGKGRALFFSLLASVGQRVEVEEGLPGIHPWVVFKIHLAILIGFGLQLWFSSVPYGLAWATAGRAAAFQLHRAVARRVRREYAAATASPKDD